MRSTEKGLLGTDEVETRSSLLIQRMKRGYFSALLVLLPYIALPEPLTQPGGGLDLDPKCLEACGKFDMEVEMGFASTIHVDQDSFVKPTGCDSCEPGQQRSLLGAKFWLHPFSK
jgi:hypothetical protein